MHRRPSGLLVRDETPGWRTQPEHDWAARPLLIPRGPRTVEYRPVKGASRQYFAEVLAPIMEADQTAATGTSEAALWPVSPWTAMVANQLQPGQVYEFQAGGIMTTAGSSPGTLTITPRWGTTSSGTSFGASAASGTLTVSKTNVPWTLVARLQCRTIGATGSVLVSGVFNCDQAGVNTLCFGGSAASVDTTAAQGLWVGVTLGSASDSMTTQFLIPIAWN